MNCIGGQRIEVLVILADPDVDILYAVIVAPAKLDRHYKSGRKTIVSSAPV